MRSEYFTGSGEKLVFCLGPKLSSSDLQARVSLAMHSSLKQTQVVTHQVKGKIPRGTFTLLSSLYISERKLPSPSSTHPAPLPQPTPPPIASHICSLQEKQLGEFCKEQERKVGQPFPKHHTQICRDIASDTLHGKGKGCGRCHKHQSGAGLKHYRHCTHLQLILNHLLSWPETNTAARENLQVWQLKFQLAEEMGPGRSNYFVAAGR